jgi:hypothetical protein
MAEVTLATLAAQLAALLERIDAVEQKLGVVERTLSDRMAVVEQTLGDRILAVERKLDTATGGGKLTLAFLSRQQDKVLREQAALRAELRSHIAALIRLDSSVEGLTG